MGYTQQTLISYSSRDREVQDKIMTGRFSVWWGHTSLLCPHMTGGARDLSVASFIRALIPFRRAQPGWPNHLSKGHSIQPIALCFLIPFFFFVNSHLGQWVMGTVLDPCYSAYVRLYYSSEMLSDLLFQSHSPDYTMELIIITITYFISSLMW